MNRNHVIRMRHLILLDIGIVFLSFVLAGLIRFETTADIAANLARHSSLLWLSLLIRLPTYLLLPVACLKQMVTTAPPSL